MTVYELIQKLTEFDPNRKVTVTVYGSPDYFKEYLDEGVNGKYTQMWVEGTVDTIEQQSDYSRVEIVCDLERL